MDITLGREPLTRRSHHIEGDAHTGQRLAREIISGLIRVHDHRCCRQRLTRKMAEQSEETVQKSRRLANMFKFLLPSNYLPGKQKWGAF